MRLRQSGGQEGSTYPALEGHREKALLLKVKIQQFCWEALRYKWYIEIQDKEEYLEYLEDPSRKERLGKPPRLNNCELARSLGSGARKMESSRIG